MVILDHISKSFSSKEGTVVALNDISFQAPDGSLFGIIGPDGAGKTTMFRILVSLLMPDKGQATVNGFDVVKDYKSIRGLVGYMPGKFSLYQDLTVEENLEFFASIFNTTIQENYDLIKDIYVQIEPFKNRRAGALSGGMKQKLALSCALIHRPKVLFMDEPTTGVDAVSRKEFWAMLKKLKSQGITILVSTPYMDEASLCDSVALIQNGKLLGVDTPQGIIDGFDENIIEIKASKMNALLRALKSSAMVMNAYPSGVYHHALLQKGVNMQQLKASLIHEFPETELQEIKPDIEDCFMHMMS